MSVQIAWRAVAVLLTALAAVAYGCCFPTTGWRDLAWIAQVPFLIMVRRVPAIMAAFLGWVFAIVVAHTTGDWFARAVSSYYAQPHLVGLGFFFGVSTVMAAPYVMAFTVCYQRLAQRFTVALPFLTAAAWVAGELGRSKLLSGCPWALFGYSQASNLRLIQVADVTGVYGVSFILVAVNAALAELWLRREGAWRQCLAGLALALTVAAGCIGYGQYRLHETDPSAGPATMIGIVQGNVEMGSQWRPDLYGRNLDVYLRMTRDTLATTPPLLLFWPESAMTFFLDEEPLYRQAIAVVLEPSNTQLIAGGPRSNGPESNQFFNSTFLVAPDGTVHAHYDKQYLLPFAEHFPIPYLDFLRRSFGRVREFTPGSPTPPLPSVAGCGGVIICNEAMFPEPAGKRVAEGAEYLINPSNDSWLGDEKFSEQVFDMITFRAIEQRRYLVRTSTAGPSGIVDPSGRVTERTRAFARESMRGEIRGRRGSTFYSRLGDVFALICAIVVAIALLRVTFIPGEKLTPSP